MRIFFVVLFCLFGCSQKQTIKTTWFENNDKIKVLSTTAMIDDLVGQIGGDRVDHIPLITGEIDPHSYELVKGDDEKISHAQIVVANGLNLEHGASWRYQLQQHPHVVFLGEDIRSKVPERILVIGKEVDPHVWMDISLWAEGVSFIVEALSREDPEHRSYYQENGERLQEKMLEKHREIKDQMLAVPSEKRYLVTSHDAFNYFTRAYLAQGPDWQKRCMAPEGLAPEGQLSSLDIQRVIDYIREHHVEVVFPESNVSRDALKKIISACRCPVRISKIPLYGDAMGPAGSDADNYLGMIEHDANALREEWGK